MIRREDQFRMGMLIQRETQDIKDAKKLPRDEQDEIYDEIMEDLMLLPESQCNDQRTLATLRIYNLLKDNPGTRYTIAYLTNEFDQSKHKDQVAQMGVSDELVRRALDKLIENEMGIVKEKVKDVTSYYYDEKATNAGNHSASDDLLEIYLAEILDDNKGKFLTNTQICEVLMNDYSFPSVDHKKIGRILNTMCIFDKRYHRSIEKGVSYYIASDKTPQGYVSPENIDNYFDL